MNISQKTARVFDHHFKIIGEELEKIIEKTTVGIKEEKVEAVDREEEDINKELSIWSRLQK